MVQMRREEIMVDGFLLSMKKTSKLVWIIPFVCITLCLASCHKNDASVSPDKNKPGSTQKVELKAIPKATVIPTSSIPSPTAEQPENDIDNSTDWTVIFHKTGCFIGVNDTWTIHSDGNLEYMDRLKNRASKKIPAQDLEPMYKVLFSKEFSDLKPIYQAAGADLCVYTITRKLSGGKEQSVTTMDAAEYPQILKDAIVVLAKLTKEMNR
jgi:hypothetical protein